MQKRLKKTLISLVVSTSFSGGLAFADTGLLSQPSLSRDHLAFVYSGDIWLADRDGQHPVRLTSHPAAEFSPVFSPDGKWLAFSASYDNNTDVYVMPATGGTPKRLTWHPGIDLAVGWSPDSKRVLFSSAREISNSRSTQLYEVSIEGGFEHKVMQAIAYEGNWSADGKYLAYRPMSQAYNGNSGWRQHRGGSTPPIWIMDVKANQLEKIPHENATDKAPVWIGDDVYFISDRNDGAANLFSYNRRSKAVTQLTKETEWDVRSLSTFGKTIVYEAGGVLKEFNTENRTTRNLSIDLSSQIGQTDQARPQWKDASANLTSASLSPTGKRVVITARGDVFTVPVKDGSVRNLTASDGIREKDAIWSPDGQHIAYLSDAGIHHSIILREQTGVDTAKSYSLGKSGYFHLLGWSPDSQKILFEDNHLHIFVLNIADGKMSTIDESARRTHVAFSFSNDSRWLAYTVVGANHFSQIKLHDFTTGKNTPLTDGLSHADNPAFAQGDYLYFTSSNNSGPTQVGLDMSTQERPLRNGIYAVVLAANGKSPLLPKSDDENSKDEHEDKNDAKKDAKNDAKKDAKSEAKKDDVKAAASSGEKSSNKADDATKKNVKPVHIDLANIQQRIVALPVAEKNIDSLLVAADGGLFYLDHPQPGISNDPPKERNANSASLMRFNFDDKKTKLIKSGIANYSLSADGKKILLRSEGAKLEIADAAEKIEPKAISLSGLKMRIDPRAEWQQIFNETWWMEKEFFYDPNLHGIDWDKIYSRYHALLKDVQRREDLNTILVQMIAELQVGHNRVGGGDVHHESSTELGLLGADFSLEQGHVRIAKIFRGDRWNPFLKAPLAVPGLDVKEGDFLLAVNGKSLDPQTNVYSLFENTVDKQVRLTICRDLASKKTHDIIVEPIANEASLRQWQWIEKNREYVQRKSNGRVAYVYLPDTGSDGYQYFNRMFYAQADKTALIIDDRRNSGGQAANYVTDILNRQYLAGWKDRDGLVYESPGTAIYGPKAMLIDQDAGSGGDFLPYAFKRLGLGSLIGKRTWGGLIGISANPELIDGGSLVVPFFRVFSPEGKWVVENEGVSPDIDVDLDPTEVNRGNDPQLDAAINNVMEKLKTYQDIKLKNAPAMPTQLGK